ncbi:MAG: DUF6282 family protein [Candidatus Methanomethylicia archaeon]
MNLLRDSIDMHIHSAPDIFNRKIDAFELAIRAKKAGMKAIVLKSHHTPTTMLSWALSRMINGIGIYGSVTLNTPSTGGINPEAVNVALKLGARVVWMPTISASNHLAHEGKKGGIKILRNGEVIEEVKEILNIVAEENRVIATGHLSVEETVALVDTAKSIGVKKLVVTHPELHIINMPLEIQKELAGKGAYIEYCCYLTTRLGGLVEAKLIVERIKSIGAEHCILSSDLGQPENPYPDEGFEQFLKKLREESISMEELRVMTVTNPTRLLELT